MDERLQNYWESASVEKKRKRKEREKEQNKTKQNKSKNLISGQDYCLGPLSRVYFRRHQLQVKQPDRNTVQIWRQLHQTLGAPEISGLGEHTFRWTCMRILELVYMHLLQHCRQVITCIICNYVRTFRTDISSEIRFTHCGRKFFNERESQTNKTNLCTRNNICPPGRSWDPRLPRFHTPQATRGRPF